MRFNKLIVGLLLAATACVPCVSFANEGAVKAQTKADFGAVVSAVKSQIVPGGRYEFVSGPERQTIDINLAEMQLLFDRFDTVAAMDKDAKFKLYVDQENVNAILTHRDDRRMVCVSERPIGSLIPKRVCRTYGAVEHDRQNTQQQLIRSARPGYIWNDSNPGGATGGMSGAIRPGSVH